MPKNLPATCKVCGLRRRDGVAISRRGLCPTHAMDAYLKSLEVAAERGRQGGLIGGPIGMASRWAGHVKGAGGAAKKSAPGAQRDSAADAADSK